MTLNKQNQAAWQRQPHNQTHRRRLVSPGDVTYVLASLFLDGMQLLPASQRIGMINKASILLTRLLHIANVHSARTIRQHLNAVFGPDRPPDVVERDVRWLLTMTIWNSLVIHILPVLPQQQIADLVPIDGISCLDDYLARGHPVLIWGYHFGVHPLIVAALLHARGYPIHAVTHARQMPVAASPTQRFYLLRLQHIGNQFPVIDPREGVQRKMLDILRNKECLYVTPDYMIKVDETQLRPAFVVPIDFLERRSYLQTGGLRLAKRLEAKVITVLSTQDDGGERRLVVEPFELPTSGLTPGDLKRDLQMCMQRLEVQVLAHPYLWWDLKRDDLLERLRTIPRDKPAFIERNKEGQTNDECQSSPYH